MGTKEIYDFLFKLYDYADFLIDKIHNKSPDSRLYFVSLIYIEDMMDRYGRGLINDTARQINNEDTESLHEAHRRIDILRIEIGKLKTEYNFEDALSKSTEKLLRDWDRESYLKLYK